MMVRKSRSLCKILEISLFSIMVLGWDVVLLSRWIKAECSVLAYNDMLTNKMVEVNYLGKYKDGILWTSILSRGVELS